LLIYVLGALAVFLSLFLPGYVFLGLFRSDFTCEERIALSFVVTIPIQCLIVLLGALFFVPWYVFGIIDCLFVALSMAFFIRRKLHRDLIEADLFGIEATLFMFMLSCLFVALPSPIAYASFNIKVQHLLDTPAADNYIPYRIAQFVINRLDLQHTTFLGDWSIADRTPLMGLVAAFLLQVLHVNVPSEFLWTLPAAAQGNSYQFFQMIGCFLNSLVILGAYMFLKQLFNRKVAQITTILLVVSSFVLLNTIFTWPKNLAAYFVFISYYLLLKGRAISSGFAASLAFLSHPLGAIYVVGGSVYAIYKKAGRIFFLSSVLTVLPWFLWSLLLFGAGGISRFVYYPISPSTVPPPNQPTYVLEQFIKTPLKVVLWNRVVTAYNMLAPFPLSTRITPETSIVNTILVPTTIFTLAGALGLSMFLFCYYGFARSFRLYKKELTSFVIVPFLVILIETGWAGGLNAWHILQPLVPIMLALGVASVVYNKNLLTAISFLYVLQNLLVLWVWSYPYTFLGQVWKNDPLILVLVLACYALVAIWSANYLLPKLRIFKSWKMTN